MKRTFLLSAAALAAGAAAWADGANDVEESTAAVGALTQVAGDAAAGPDFVQTLLISSALLLCSSFFSGSETALFSLQPIDRTALSETERIPVDQLLERPRRTLASLLIGNEFVNVLLSTVTAGLILSLFPGRPWINVLVLTPLLLVFGEVLPKTLALRHNRRIAPLVAVPLLLFARAVSPLRWILTRIADAFLILTGGSRAPGQAALREAHLITLIDQGREAGAVRPMEQEMIQKVFEFGDLTVSRLMTPRPDVFSLSLSTPWEVLIDEVRGHSQSRVPIWQGAPDNVIGVLVVKDLLPRLATRFRDADGDLGDPRQLSLTTRQVQKMLHPAHFVPTNKRAEDMLAEFREHKFHLSMVVDEHGNVVGLVTLDDLLAELVGELLDESDALENDVSQVSDGVFNIRGSMDVDDFRDRFSLPLPEGDYDTVAGFLLNQAGTVPAKGAEVTWEDVRFTVRGLEGRRITEVCVHLPSTAGTDDLAVGEDGT